ncbi:MAG: hypothetical protein FJ125_14750 [Deltaproteobacteria bacterium]|nr:hypothetical protein [Deltaproteobacteria bacterium]
MLKLEDLNQTSIEQAIQEFYKTMNSHVARLVMDMAHERYSIPRDRRRMGNAEFQYYFAADLDLLFRYALGGVEASGTLIEDIVRTVVDLLEIAPNGGRSPMEWDRFGDTPLGTALKAAEARVRLRRQSEPLSSEEICLLSGWNVQKLASAKLTKAAKKPGTFYEPASVKEAFDKDGVRV